MTETEEEKENAYVHTLELLVKTYEQEEKAYKSMIELQNETINTYKEICTKYEQLLHMKGE